MTVTRISVATIIGPKPGEEFKIASELATVVVYAKADRDDVIFVARAMPNTHVYALQVIMEDADAKTLGSWSWSLPRARASDAVAMMIDDGFTVYEDMNFPSEKDES